MPEDSIRTALTELRRSVLADSDGEPTATSIAIPAKYADDQNQALFLDEHTAEQMAAVTSLLTVDLRFEHLNRPERAVHEFVADCYFDPTADVVNDFIAHHAKPVLTVEVYVTVDHLTVAEPTTLGGVALLPIDDSEVPPAPPLPSPVTAQAVAKIQVTGTDTTKMADRARAQVRHALKTLRIALRAHPGIHDSQLLFTVGEHLVFADGRGAWSRASTAAVDLAVSADLADLVNGQRVSTLGTAVRTDIVEKANLAATWIERARFADEPLLALLMLFFALEALLGDRSAGLKALPLAERQMILSHAVNGSFSHPDDTWFLYDTVRSTAVHGGVAPDIDTRLVQKFEMRVRRTLDEYLQYADREGLVKRGRLLRRLDEHADRAQLRDWLRTNADRRWADFLDRTA